MCFAQRVVKQLVRLSCLEDCVQVDHQMKVLFRTVFNQRIKAGWKEPEKREIADLLRLNDLTLRDGYRFRLACSQKYVKNSLVMRSAAEFVVEDFPGETQPLSESLHWGDELTMHRYHNIHDNVDLYNEYWNHPDWQPNVDMNQVPHDHLENWWELHQWREEEPEEFEPDEYYANDEDEEYYPVDKYDISPVEMDCGFRYHFEGRIPPARPPKMETGNNNN